MGSYQNNQMADDEGTVIVEEINNQAMDSILSTSERSSGKLDVAKHVRDAQAAKLKKLRDHGRKK